MTTYSHREIVTTRVERVRFRDGGYGPMSTERGDADLDLRAITVGLPWAAAIRNGKKLIENRTLRRHATKYRGLVAIHASAPSGWSREGANDPRMLHWWWGDGRARTAPALDATDFAPLFRKIVALARLVDCHEEVRGCCQPWGDRGVWHLVLEDVRELPEPIAAVGSLALPWRVPEEVAAKVLDQLAEVPR